MQIAEFHLNNVNIDVYQTQVEIGESRSYKIVRQLFTYLIISVQMKFQIIRDNFWTSTSYQLLIQEY